MIIKSLVLLSIFFNLVGLSKTSDKIDDAIVRQRTGSNNIVSASAVKDLTLPEILPRPIVKETAPKAYANARHYFLADAETSIVLAKEDAKAEVPIASTTKIMSAVVALENYQLDDIVTISPEASQQIGADAFLLPGEQITVESLLNCMLIKSGNDAAYALAEHMNDATETGYQKFVTKMNEKAKELGMENTHYLDPAGLDTKGYSSAFDLFLVTKYALEKSEFRQIVKKDRYVAKNINSTIWHELDNSNRLVSDYKYPGAIGVKTGYMPEAGHCLVGAAQRNGRTLISIVLNTYLDTPTASADEARKLLDWGFENVYWE